jgi:hypothetical protein
MSTATLNCSYNKYNIDDGALYSPSGGTGIFAGKTTGGASDYKIFLGFSATSYSGATFNAATFRITRYVDASSAAHTLYIRVVDSVNESAGTYTNVDSTVVTFSVTANASAKTVDIAALMPALAAASTRRLLIYSTANGQYTEFYATATSTISIALDYTASESGVTIPMQIQIDTDGTFKDIIFMEIETDTDEWHNIILMEIQTAPDVWKRIF